MRHSSPDQSKLRDSEVSLSRRLALLDEAIAANDQQLAGPDLQSGEGIADQTETPIWDFRN